MLLVVKYVYVIYDIFNGLIVFFGRKVALVTSVNVRLSSLAAKTRRTCAVPCIYISWLESFAFHVDICCPIVKVNSVCDYPIQLCFLLRSGGLANGTSLKKRAVITVIFRIRGRDG